MSRDASIKKATNRLHVEQNVNLVMQICLTLVAIIVVINSVIFSYIWISQEYLGNDTANAVLGTTYDPVGFSLPQVSKPAISFGKNLNTQCPQLTGAGASCPHHWFGDFFANFDVVQTAKPWSYGENPNFPASNFLTKVLTIFPYRFAVTFYLTLMALALMFPIWYSSKKLQLNLRILITVVLGLMSYPALFALDRGNTQGFVPLFLFTFALLNLTEIPTAKFTKVLAPLLFAWKIHTWPALIVSSRNKWKSNLRIFSIGLAVTTFCLLPWVRHTRDFAIGISKTFLGMTSTASDPNLGIWRNQSLSGLFYTLHLKLLHRTLLLNWRISITLGTAYAIYVSYLIVKRNYPMWIKIFLAGSIMQMSVPRGYGYGASYLIAVVAILIFESLSLNQIVAENSLQIFKRGKRGFIVTLLLGFLLSLDFPTNPAYVNNIITAKNFIEPICTLALVMCLHQTYKSKKELGNSKISKISQKS